MRANLVRPFVTYIAIFVWFCVAGFAKDAAGKPSIRTVYIVPSSHWDYGFIVPPEEIRPKLKPHIDEVIAECKADPDFRWTIESVWQINAWLERTNDPKQIADFVDLVKKGQIQVSAVWGSMHTEFMSAEQLDRIAYGMKDLQQRFGITTDFAMMDDVPGFSLRLPQVLARSGVKYFLNGSNTPFGGGTSLYPGKIPFYWSSPDGSRVLMWQTQGKNGGYTEVIADYFLDPLAEDPYASMHPEQKDFHFYPKEWNGLSPLEIMQRGMNKLLKQYKDAGYPYDAVVLMDLHDFIPPSWERDHLLPSVRAWNAAGKEPRIVVATPDEFFHYMESKYGSKFQTRMGDWSGLWSENKTNSPGISANARWAQDHAPVAEMVSTLLSLEDGSGFPGPEIEKTWWSLLKYDEHSGAGQYGWPKVMSRAEVEQQNTEYVNYARDAKTDADRLISTGLQTFLAQRPDPATKHEIAVFNPLSWERSGSVRMEAAAGQNVQLRDLATNAVIPAQRVSPSEVEFVAEAVPPIGYRTYAIEPSDRSDPVAGTGSETEIENEYYRLKVGTSDGAVVSLFDKQLRRELVNLHSGDRLNQLLRWAISRNLAQLHAKVNIRRESGPLEDALIIERPDTYWPVTRISFPRQRKAVVIDNTVVRSRAPFVDSAETADTYSFCFPFDFTGSSQLWVDSGNGFYAFPNDLLPGAKNDAVVPQHSIAMESTHDSHPYYVVLSQRQSFYDYVVAFPGENGAPGAFVNEVRPTVFRKVDKGDTRDQGLVSFATTEPGMPDEQHYSFEITSDEGAFNPAKSYRAGTEFDIPLITVPLKPGTRPAAPTNWFFSIGAPNVVISAFRPSVDGNPDHYMLRLQEIAGQKTSFKMSARLRVAAIQETTMTEDPITGRTMTFANMTIGPNQTLTLRLDLPHGPANGHAQ